MSPLLWLFSLLHIVYLLLFSCSVVSDSLQPQGLQHTRFPCPSDFLDLAQTHVHWIGDSIQPSCPPSSPSPPALNLSQHWGLFLPSQFFASGGQSIGVSASPSVLLVNIQGWFHLELTGLSIIFSSTAVRKHQFFSTQPSLWSNSHIHTWLLEKP